MPLHDDVGRLIVAQFRWLDFLVDADAFVAKLMELLSVAPPWLKKEIIGSLPEIVGDQSHAAVVAALEKLLQEDSDVVVSALDALSDLNLSEQLQEQAVTVAISCIRTVQADQMPHLLRFLLLSATPFNAGRIISQIREQLKFVGMVDPRASRGKKLKGKASANGTDGAILDALSSGLRFKNMLCEAFLKELKSVDNPRDHKVIDVWLIMLIYANGGALQKSAEKILKSKILQLCIRETLFDQCIRGNTELAKDHFMSYLSVSDFLLACKEEKAREFAAYLFTALFEEFNDTFSRQELVGSLVAHIGSGVSFEVSSALDIMISLSLDKSEELIPVSSYITGTVHGEVLFCLVLLFLINVNSVGCGNVGILDYLESFQEDNLRKVYEIFCHLALAAGFNTGSGGSSVANELIMVVRKQVSNPDMKYKRMGIIGALRIVSTISDVNASMNCSSSQQSNYDEALELLKMTVKSCKFAMLPLILLYDELAVLLESSVIHSEIVDWVGEHVGEFATVFLADLDNGELSNKYVCDGIEGELWMNLDGTISPILPSQFSLLTTIERLGSQGSLGGINAVLGCPLHLPSPKHLDGARWGSLSAMQKKTVCHSLYYAINWMRELLNAFSTQVAARVDNISQRARDETAVKLLMRMRNLILLEGLLNAYLKIHPLSLPDLQYVGDHGSSSTSKFNLPKKMGDQNMEGNVSRKRQKGHKDTSSDKSNSDEKLRQPTILDAFKRAGVTISQETNRDSQPSSSGMTSRDMERETNSPCKFGIIDLVAPPAQLDMQRFKFRTLHVTCLSLLNYSEPQDSTSSYHESEMPLYLYLLRDLHSKLDNLNPSSKPFFNSSQVNSTHAYWRKSMDEFLSKIQPLFSSLRNQLNGAVSMIKDDSCPYDWNSHSASAGNPDIPYVVVLKSSVATSVFKEVLCCYRKLLGVPDLLNQTNISVLKELLQTFQPTENFDDVLSEFSPSLVPSNLDYLYCGANTMLAAIMDLVCSFSYLLAYDVLITMQSILNNVIMLFEKSGEQNGKNIHMGCSKEILPFLRKHLGLSARKLLTSDLPSEDAENGWQSKGDLIQKILQIYLKNSDSTSDLLDELACSVLPEVPSLKTGSTQDMSHGFPTLCSSTILSWYRVLHEENTGNLNKMIKQVLKIRPHSERAVETALEEIHKSVIVFVSLINMCKIHKKVAMHAMAVKHGGRFVDAFLKAFNFLEKHFGQHNDIILQMLKSLQKATRTIQTICSEAKGHKRTMITSKIPAAKRSLERFVFQAKALLHNSTEDILCIRNLRHKDLQGHLVSSQVYGSVDDSPDEEQEQMETNSEAQADENGNAMDEDVAEDGNEAPLEE
uniref:Fanconi anemia group D2 protein n=1 Tax=Oryza brachyantha TaxID=4533 RepID=J3MIN2_ORYBR